jgi:hypothetical protein
MSIFLDTLVVKSPSTISPPISSESDICQRDNSAFTSGSTPPPCSPPDIAPKPKIVRKRRTFTLKVARGLSIRDAMNALEARLAAHRREQEALWDKLLGSDRAMHEAASGR